MDAVPTQAGNSHTAYIADHLHVALVRELEQQLRFYDPDSVRMSLDDLLNGWAKLERSLDALVAEAVRAA